MKKITILTLLLLLASSLNAYQGNQGAFNLGASIGSGLGGSTKSSTNNSSNDDSHSSNEDKTINFIASNMNKLALESAQGQGETIDALSVMLNKDNKVLAAKMQKNFDVIFSSANVTPANVAKKIATL